MLLSYRYALVIASVCCFLFASPSSASEPLNWTVKESLTFTHEADNTLLKIKKHLKRLHEVATLCTDDRNTSDDRYIGQLEIENLARIINYIANGKQINNAKVFDSSHKAITVLNEPTAEKLTFSLKNMSAYALGAQPGLYQITGLPVSTVNGKPDEGRQGVQTGRLETELKAGDVIIQVDGKASIDIAAERFGGAIKVAAESGRNSAIAKIITNRINNIRTNGASGFSTTFASARTSFKSSDLTAQDYHGHAIPSPANHSISAGSLKSGQLSLNNIGIPAVSFNAYDYSGELVKAINTMSAISGVEASVTEDGELHLIAEGGVDIIINIDEAGAETLFGGGNSSSFDSGFYNLRITGQVTLSDESKLILSGVTLSDAGLNQHSSQNNNAPTHNVQHLDVTSPASANTAVKVIKHALLQLEAYRNEIDTFKFQLTTLSSREY